MRWRIAKVMSKLEEKFILDLTLQSLALGLIAEQHFYCPFVPTLTKPKGKRKPVLVNCAAYPGYSFISEDAARVFGAGALKRIAGFRSFMAIRGESVSIKDCEIVQMREREKGWERMAKDRGGTDLKAGDCVRVESGLMCGESGIIEKMYGQWAEVRFRKEWPSVRFRAEFLERV